jgi:hypothetical protein
MQLVVETGFWLILLNLSGVLTPRFMYSPTTPGEVLAFRERVTLCADGRMSLRVDISG